MQTVQRRNLNFFSGEPAAFDFLNHEKRKAEKQLRCCTFRDVAVQRDDSIGAVLSNEDDIGVPLYIYPCDETGQVTGGRINPSKCAKEFDRLLVVGQNRDFLFRVRK